MQKKAGFRAAGILIEVIDAITVKAAGATNYSMYLVSFVEEEFGKIGAVLTGYSCY